MIGDDDSRADVIEAVGNGVGGKQGGYWHGHETGLPARDMGYRGPRILAQQQHHSVGLLTGRQTQED